ncbi:MAG: EamA family transporter RarD [Desulfarculus sp.]|nr:EamA family transporter RarD [Desulfarculus sp.]
MDNFQPDKRGVLLAAGAFAWWGLVPIYFKAVAGVGPLEVLAHRILWSAPLAGLILALQGGGFAGLIPALAQRGVLRTLCLSSLLVAGNWLLFIHAVDSGQVLQSSLGYFIAPLVNVLLGMAFLGERPGRWQWVALGLAGLGTLNLVLRQDGPPWIALTLAVSFSLYGLLRKRVAIESVAGLFIETLLLAPLSLAWLGYEAWRGGLVFGHGGGGPSLLLMAAGVITTLPLIWFTAGARRIPLYVLGVCQYIAPSLQFLLAVCLYGEPFSGAQLTTFALVWGGLAVFVLAGLPIRGLARSSRRPG